MSAGPGSPGAGPGAAGLLWLWATVADHGPGAGPVGPSRPAAGQDHGAGSAGDCPASP